MRDRACRPILAILAILAASAAGAEVDTHAACAALADPDARLACHDRLAPPPAAPRPLATDRSVTLVPETPVACLGRPSPVLLTITCEGGQSAIVLDAPGCRLDDPAGLGVIAVNLGGWDGTIDISGQTAPVTLARGAEANRLIAAMRRRVLVTMTPVPFQFASAWFETAPVDRIRAACGW